MKNQTWIALTLMLNLLIATHSAAGGALESLLPKDPVSAELELVPFTEAKSFTADSSSASCAAQLAEEQMCIREYVDGRVDETGYDDCAHRALAAKYLCLNQADAVALAE